jgi:hypothetical protein
MLHNNDPIEMVSDRLQMNAYEPERPNFWEVVPSTILCFFHLNVAISGIHGCFQNLERSMQRSQYDSDRIRIQILSIVKKNVSEFRSIMAMETLILQQIPACKS